VATTVEIRVLGQERTSLTAVPHDLVCGDIDLDAPPISRPEWSDALDESGTAPGLRRRDERGSDSRVIANPPAPAIEDRPDLCPAGLIIRAEIQVLGVAVSAEGAASQRGPALEHDTRWTQRCPRRQQPLDTVSDTPVEIVGPVRQIYAACGYPTKILSCGRFPRGVGAYAAAGTDMITLRREFLGAAYEHPYTDKRISGFLSDWARAYGDATWPGE